MYQLSRTRHHWNLVYARRTSASGFMTLAMCSVVSFSQSGLSESCSRPHWWPHSWRYVSATRTMFSFVPEMFSAIHDIIRLVSASNGSTFMAVKSRHLAAPDGHDRVAQDVVAAALRVVEVVLGDEVGRDGGAVVVLVEHQEVRLVKVQRLAGAAGHVLRDGGVARGEADVAVDQMQEGIRGMTAGRVRVDPLTHVRDRLVAEEVLRARTRVLARPRVVVVRGELAVGRQPGLDVGIVGVQVLVEVGAGAVVARRRGEDVAPQVARDLHDLVGVVEEGLARHELALAAVLPLELARYDVALRDDLDVADRARVQIDQRHQRPALVAQDVALHVLVDRARGARVVHVDEPVGVALLVADD